MLSIRYLPTVSILSIPSYPILHDTAALFHSPFHPDTIFEYPYRMIPKQF